MFASPIFEDVPCPDPDCWRGFVCNFSHDPNVVHIKRLLSSLVGDASFPLQANTTPSESAVPDSNPAINADVDISLPSSFPPPLPPLLKASENAPEKVVKELEAKDVEKIIEASPSATLSEPSSKKESEAPAEPPLKRQRVDVKGESAITASPQDPEKSRKRVRWGENEYFEDVRAAPAAGTPPAAPLPATHDDVYVPEFQSPPELPPLLPPLADSPPSAPPPDLYVPEYKPSPDELGVLRSSIEDVEKRLTRNAPTEPTRTLRGSIEEVGRKLSKLVNNPAPIPARNSLPRIGEIERQLSRPNAKIRMPFKVPKVKFVSLEEVEGRKEPTNHEAADIQPVDYDISTQFFSTPQTHEPQPSIRSTPTSSKPIPSIQKKFLINPPIESKLTFKSNKDKDNPDKKKPNEETTNKNEAPQPQVGTKKVVAKGKPNAKKQEEEEEEDEEEEEESDEDEEGSDESDGSEEESEEEGQTTAVTKPQTANAKRPPAKPLPPGAKSLAGAKTMTKPPAKPTTTKSTTMKIGTSDITTTKTLSSSGDGIGPAKTTAKTTTKTVTQPVAKPTQPVAFKGAAAPKTMDGSKNVIKSTKLITNTSIPNTTHSHASFPSKTPTSEPGNSPPFIPPAHKPPSMSSATRPMTKDDVTNTATPNASKLSASQEGIAAKPKTMTLQTYASTKSAKPAGNVKLEKPESMISVGMCLTPQQMKAAQQHRVDNGKTFAAGMLTATEYPTILFEFRAKVPRAVRQNCLDKFLIEFLRQFPNNKKKAIDAAVKIEQEIYTQAQTKSVYVNLCAHQMKTLFPSV